MDWLSSTSCDERLGLALLLFPFVMIALYAMRFVRFGRARSARVDQQGGSILLSRSSKEFGYWVLNPPAIFLARVGFSANQVSWASLIFGIGAGVAIAASGGTSAVDGAGLNGAVNTSYFGWAAVFSFLAMVFDVFDGIIARADGTSSDAGEILDATLDRYVEFFFLGALVVFYRQSIGMILVGLFAFMGSFMVSYSTAKAEAMQTPPPPTGMRRPERAFLMVLGADLSSLSWRFETLHGVPVRALPLAVAMIWLAVGTNIAAPIRLYRIACQLRRGAPR